jgi:hypothetical protein
MAKLITYSKPRQFVGFAGVTEADKLSVNNFRQMTAKLFEAINIVWKPRTHRGKPIGYSYTFDGTDSYGTFLIWAFPVFVRNKDEMVISVKVWTGSIHGGSCLMWCQPPYQFTDAPSAVQFETQLNTAVNHAEQMVKRWTRKANQTGQI